MTFLGKFLTLSIFVLVVSFIAYKSIDVHNYGEQILFIYSKIFDILLDIDSFFKYFHINCFYRGLEKQISNLAFYMVNRTDLTIEEKVFDGIPVILFSPIKHDKNRPAVIYIHGGGWNLFNPKFFSIFTAELARRLNMLIVSVDYQKAPEHPFPHAVHDVLAATKYFLINAARFDVNPYRIALMGDSAGGNLVISVGYHLAALKKLHKEMRVPKVLIPLNPVLQIVDFNTPSYRDDGKDMILNKNKVAKFICIYAFGELSRSDLDDCKTTLLTNSHLNAAVLETVKENVDWSQYLTGRGYDNRPKSSFNYKPNRFVKRLSELAADPLFSPLSALNNTELAVLPPVYFLSATHDPLRDDAKILAARLAKVGHLGGYSEYDHHHCSFLLASTKMKPSVDAFNQLISIFEKNSIL